MQFYLFTVCDTITSQNIIQIFNFTDVYKQFIDVWDIICET